MSSDAAIKLRIAKTLKRLRINQEHVAKVLAVPRSAISAIESGKREVTAYELFLICSLANVSPNEVLGWDTPKANIKLNGEVNANV